MIEGEIVHMKVEVLGINDELFSGKSNTGV